MSDLYVKGEQTRLVDTPAERVAAEFAGFKPVKDVRPENTPYRDLQKQAQALGIPGNQSAAELAAQIAAFEAEGGPTVEADEKSETLGEAPETDDGGSPLES
jgi:hypothetical protein